MVCKKCGKINNEDSVFCSCCGTSLAIDSEAERLTRIVKPEEIEKCDINAEKENVKSAKKHKASVIICCALIIVAVALSGTVAGIAISTNSKKKYADLLKEYTPKPVVTVAADDFNKDGTVEAYAVTGTEDKDGFKDADIWYINEANDVQLVRRNVSGKYNGFIDGKGASFELVNEDNTTSEEILPIVPFESSENKSKEVNKVVKPSSKQTTTEEFKVNSFDDGFVVVENETTKPEKTTSTTKSTTRSTTKSTTKSTTNSTTNSTTKATTEVQTKTKTTSANNNSEFSIIINGEEYKIVYNYQDVATIY